MTFNEIVGRFENVRPCAGGVSARCSAHNDHANSLKISEAPDRTLLNCHAGCDTKDVLSAKGLGMADLFLSPRNGSTSNGHTNHSSNGVAKALTLDQFAAAKGFSIEYLTQHGIAEEKGGLIFHYKLKNGQKAARQRIRLALTGDKRFIWNRAEGKPVPYGLWRLDEAQKRGSPDLYLVEGESDTLTLWLHNLEAIGLPGADNVKILQGAHLAGFHRVFIVRENDGGGEVFEKGLTGRLAELEYAGRVAVIEMGKAAVKDANDLHVKLIGDAGGFESEWQELIEQARAVELPLVGIEDFDDAQVQVKPLEWLWLNRIPLGKLVLFVGAPGLGKSFASLDIIAHLSDGRDWPDGAKNGLIAKSILFSAEDDLHDTIKPRLIAQGAVPGHTRIMGRMREANAAGDIVRRCFSLQHDLPQLERMLQKHPDAKLVVIDPVSAYMARVDTYKNSEVRSEVLDPLADLAQRYGATILCITHFNKSAGSGLDRVSGSIAFPAAARAVWGFTTDPEDITRNLFVWAKGNLAPTRIPGIAYRMAPNERGEVCLQWIAGQVDEDMASVQKREQEAQKDSGSGKLAAAKDLWLTMLANGPRAVTEIENRARELGISESTLKRARWDLGVKCSKQGITGGWKAYLPTPIVQ